MSDRCLYRPQPCCAALSGSSTLGRGRGGGTGPSKSWLAPNFGHTLDTLWSTDSVKKISKFDATGCQIKTKLLKIRFPLRLCPRPRCAWGAYSAPPDPLAVFKGSNSKGREGRKGIEGKRERKGKRNRKGQAPQIFRPRTALAALLRALINVVVVLFTWRATPSVCLIVRTVSRPTAIIASGRVSQCAETAVRVRNRSTTF